MTKPFKLCILRLSAIGDVCHAAAMVNAVQIHRPDIEITWIIGKVEYSLLKHLPKVHFVVYDKKGGKAAKQQVKAALSGTEFDALFVMQVALRANLLSRLIKAKRRIGFDWHRSKELHSLFINERIEAQPHAHVLDGFMAFAHTIGVPKNAEISWSLRPSEQDEEWFRQTFSTLRSHGENENSHDLCPYVVISPTASKAQRNWLPERYAEIADYIKSKGFHVILCGGPGPLDASTRDAIIRYSPSISMDLVGKTSLLQMLCVLKHAELVLAPDTGPAHMATTQGTKVIGLYAHSNPKRTGPYMSQSLVASVYEQCVEQQFGQSWENLPWGKRAKGDNLMAKIELEQVKQLVDEALKR
uniref:glycosyltransferase family 9 protein n=1 Tax=Ningiella ruwaisensis TaxID=2364274 RepID=UPI00109FF087|nr:glycosyltransferase family 9 protein [Ningiella ruwaisensis]